jgi:hypothetical protein
VGFFGGAEIGFYAKVDLRGAQLKPGSATASQIGQLGHFDEAKDLDIKRAGSSFTARGHCELNVIDANYLHGLLSALRSCHYQLIKNFRLPGYAPVRTTFTVPYRRRQPLTHQRSHSAELD